MEWSKCYLAAESSGGDIEMTRLTPIVGGIVVMCSRCASVTSCVVACVDGIGAAVRSRMEWMGSLNLETSLDLCSRQC